MTQLHAQIARQLALLTSDEPSFMQYYAVSLTR